MPDGEKHFPEWMDRNGEIVEGRGTYQMKKIRVALKSCRAFHTAVDVGAHVGLWSVHLARRFKDLYAFEPVDRLRACWLANMETQGMQGRLYEFALGAEPGKVSMQYNPADSGGTHVVSGAEVEMRTLDSFNIEDVDMIKIDCEGYEHRVLLGARETIKRWRPTIVVEQKPHIMGKNYGTKGTPAVDLLVEMGYRSVAILSGDYVMVAG